MKTEKYINLSSAKVENFQSRYSITGDAPDTAVLSEAVSTCPFGGSSRVVPLVTEVVFILNQEGMSLQTLLCLLRQSKMELRHVHAAEDSNRQRQDTA